MAFASIVSRGRHRNRTNARGEPRLRQDLGHHHPTAPRGTSRRRCRCGHFFCRRSFAIRYRPNSLCGRRSLDARRLAVRLRLLNVELDGRDVDEITRRLDQCRRKEIGADPGNRGIHSLFLPGELSRAAISLASAERVGIVTGFFLVDQETYETDGPPGAVALGRALRLLGIDVRFLADSFGISFLRKAGLDPFTESIDGEPPTHLISVERLGRARDGRYYSMRSPGPFASHRTPRRTLSPRGFARNSHDRHRRRRQRDRHGKGA